jgi:hypothetical protein
MNPVPNHPVEPAEDKTMAGSCFRACSHSFIAEPSSLVDAKNSPSRSSQFTGIKVPRLGIRSHRMGPPIRQRSQLRLDRSDSGSLFHPVFGGPLTSHVSRCNLSHVGGSADGFDYTGSWRYIRAVTKVPVPPD